MNNNPPISPGPSMAAYLCDSGGTEQEFSIEQYER